MSNVIVIVTPNALPPELSTPARANRDSLVLDRDDRSVSPPSLNALRDHRMSFEIRNRRVRFPSTHSPGDVRK